MLKYLLAAVLLLILVVPSAGQDPYEGLNLITPTPSFDSELRDMDGNLVKTWHGSQRPRSFAYMLPDTSIIRPCRDTGGAFDVTTAGGRIQKIDADDNIVWDYFFSTSTYQQHHDVAPMPNGNVLMLAWELRTQQEALDMGVVSVGGDIWPTYIAEVEPVGATGGNIVWEWRVWDHLVQDVDSGKPNYGVVADHPELLDMNYSGLGTGGDWVHENAIDYNPELDQIIWCSRKTNEFYIIDHSTTTEEAAGHTGGNSGMGGDILYRWGNPQVYDRGSAGDQKIDIAHGVNWVDEGLPGEGNALIFDNGSSGYSVVLEITPPLEPGGTYTIEAGLPYGPADPTWSYGGPGGFYGGPTQCGAYRMPNGNTLITASQDGYVFEVTEAGTVVWDYDDPDRIARGLRYWEDEIDAVPAGELLVRADVRLGPIHPNPFSPATAISYEVLQTANVTLAVFGVRGERIRTLLNSRPLAAGTYQEVWDGRDDSGDLVVPGVYIARIETKGSVATQKITLLK